MTLNRFYELCNYKLNYRNTRIELNYNGLSAKSTKTHNRGKYIFNNRNKIINTDMPDRILNRILKKR